MEQGRTFSSYKSLYRVKPVLYFLGDIKLPFPVNLEMVLIFAIFWAIYHLVLSVFLGELIRSVGLVPGIMSFGLAALSSWVSTTFDAAGKFIPKYLFDAAAFYVRPKTNTLAGPLRVSPKKQKCDWKVEVGK